MKFDVDIILRNCECFGVKVEKGDNLHGVTMNGNQFDVTDEMDKALTYLDNKTTVAEQVDARNKMLESSLK